MECATARIWLSRKMDGELSDLENRSLAAHMEQCAACSREYGLLSFSQRIAQEIPSWTASPFFYRKLKLRIEGERQNLAGWQVVWRLARQMVPALAGVTLALLCVFAYLQLESPEADLYGSYERIFIAEEQPHSMLAAEQGEITDISVLSAIADQESNHRNSDLK